jgi:2-phosphosulfolactate phosphatase
MVDILRATTTMITALENGIKSIVPVESVRECHELREKGFLGAAERDGKIADGFELGNSPFDYMNPSYSGKKVALTTTNGTKTIFSIQGADKIIFAAFVNVTSTADFLEHLARDVVIVCAGWKEEVNLEDTVCAGALIDKLAPSFSVEGDPAIIAHKLFVASEGHLDMLLNSASHVRRLKNLDLQKDIDFCLKMDTYRIIPEMRDGEIVPRILDQ